MTFLEQVNDCRDCGACCTAQAALPVSWYAGAAFRFGDPIQWPEDMRIREFPPKGESEHAK